MTSNIGFSSFSVIFNKYFNENMINHPIQKIVCYVVCLMLLFVYVDNTSKSKISWLWLPFSRFVILNFVFLYPQIKFPTILYHLQLQKLLHLKCKNYFEIAFWKNDFMLFYYRFCKIKWIQNFNIWGKYILNQTQCLIVCFITI